MRFATFLFLVPFLLLSQQEVDTLARLPTDISESSGLIFHNGKLITHNDSGNSAELFEIDTVSFEIARRVKVKNADNMDWEDMTMDENFIYVGDIGNTMGSRRDLVIYKIAKSDYDQNDEVLADRIDFSYEDQVGFSGSQNSDWDAEAIFSLGDNLVVLTKQWQGLGTVAYLIPKEPGDYKAKRIDGYDTNGLITGATYQKEANLLYLIGYSSILEPFIIKVEAVLGTSIFKGPIERIILDMDSAQIEAITGIGENKFVLSSELFISNTLPVRLEPHLFLWKGEGEHEEENPEEDLDEIPEPMKEQLVLYSEFGSRMLGYELITDKQIFGRAIFDLSGKRIRYEPNTGSYGDSLDLSTLNSSLYYLAFYLEDKVISKPFILY